MLRNFFRCTFGPQLYCKYESQVPPTTEPKEYQPHPIEEYVTRFTTACTVSKYAFIYTSPLWFFIMYKRDLYNLTHGKHLLTYSLYFSAFYFVSLCLRGISRMQNTEYMHFLSVLRQAEDSPSNDLKKQQLRSYDFTFTHWPIEFKAKKEGEFTFRRNPINIPPHNLTGRLKKSLGNNWLAVYLFRGLPCELISYIVAHTVGISMVYPGSTTLLSSALGPALRLGRTKLVQLDSGKRGKIQTSNHYTLDVMFVDRRIKLEDQEDTTVNLNGTKLVIACEGNAGFYEVGCMVTPLECGYSVLGWNHPGFGGSTGSPFPGNEIEAMDAVMQYAINGLGFKPQDIILFAWSIGGFDAVTAATMYPDIRGIYLDATFDDVMPLALKAMPQSFHGIVKRTIRGYLNLNIGEVMTKYDGPIHIVRRTSDEVMNTTPGDVGTNVGNSLITRLLRYRFPRLFGFKEDETNEILSVLETWLCADSPQQRASIMQEWGVNIEECERLLHEYVTKYRVRYPMDIGMLYTETQKKQLLLYLADQHLGFFDSTHCTPLPSAMFGEPWSIASLLHSPASSSEQSDDFEIVN